MSHFAVLVIGDDVDEQLAPYQENNMGDCPKQYLVFHDMTKELTEKYESGEGTGRVFLNGDDIGSKYDLKFQKLKAGSVWDKETVIPEGAVVREVPYKESYTLKQFAEEWHGYKFDEEKNAYGYWENPNKKWDWWVIGGRYNGRLKTKNDSGMVGQDGLLTPLKGDGFVDQAKFGDLDLEAMLEERRAVYANSWDDFENKTLGFTQENREKEKYWYGIDKDCNTKADYVAKAEVLSALAVVKDGKWYEKGEMGWFGIMSNEKEDNTWKLEMKDLIKDLSPDTLITYVDCHI